MRFGILALCAALLFVPGLARAQDAPAPAPNSIKLVRVIAALPVGAPWLKLSTDERGGGLLQMFLCNNEGVTQTWSGGRENQEISLYAVAFKSELARAGYHVVTPGEDNLFDAESGAADLEAAAVITDMRIEGCMSRGSMFNDRGDIRGEAAMRVDWQVYSPIQKQVVARISTSASAKLERSVPGGVQRLVSESFAANARDLVSNPQFRAALNAPRALAKGAVLPSQQGKIVLAGSLKAGKRQISDAVGSVVTIITGDSTGSGVLVSDDGYLLTNAHVVGDSKEVRVRWSDKIETLGQVIRVAKERDIAIVKASARDRTPLALKRGPVAPGLRVYAIGSPHGKDYQNTVSSGIVSATRIFDGLRYIQSDVSVSPGSSGGALLDENGQVIGITVSKLIQEGVSGLNFFIPIGDAMDFLSLEQQ
jgi:S1-C subfamily serine protease